MNEHQVHGPLRDAALEAMQQSDLFSTLGVADREIVLSHGRIFEYAPGERVVEAQTRSDAFFMILRGRASVVVPQPGQEEGIEVSRLQPYDAIGELGLLLDEPRTARVVAQSRLFVLEFEQASFQLLLDKVSGFSLRLCRVLARRLVDTSRMVELPRSEEGTLPSPELMHLLPAQLIHRHQVLPLKQEEGTLTVGFVHDPAPHILSALQRFLPGFQLRPVRIAHALFERVLQRSALGAPEAAPAPAPAAATSAAAASPADVAAAQRQRLYPLLERMMAEGASDLHLAAGQAPRWRLYGEMHALEDIPPIKPREAFELLTAGLPERIMAVLQEHQDVDFTFTAEGIARFRVNLYEDEQGYSAVMRLIPPTVPSLQQLGLPRVVGDLCRLKRGLVLVTGPTGCGKSTTLASMIDHINATRREHIVTLEDPIEFIHPSKLALVNQREVGRHTQSFERALRAALRQDPDIVLVGEMRDLATLRLALETANTGHLVLGTLHTGSAIGSIDRMVDLFPAEERDMARSIIAEVLQAIITQSLCRRRGGGRVAAFEVLVSDGAVGNMIRQGKTQQLGTTLTTGRARGNLAMVDSLHELVRKNQITAEEALLHATDRDEMKKRLTG